MTADTIISTSTIEAENLTYLYAKDRGVQGFSHVFETGITTVLGKNGAGKTTLFRLLSTVLNPTHGSLLVDGKPLTRAARQHLRGLSGWVPHRLSFESSMRLDKILRYCAWLKGVPQKSTTSRITDALRVVDLEDALHDKWGSLSDGMQRRASIACGLVNDPYLLLLDEPTSGLDPAQRARVNALLQKIASTRIVVFSTHILEDAAAIADQILYLSTSRLRASGTFNEVSNSPDRNASGIQHLFSLTP